MQSCALFLLLVTAPAASLPHVETVQDASSLQLESPSRHGLIVPGQQGFTLLWPGKNGLDMHVVQLDTFFEVTLRSKLRVRDDYTSMFSQHPHFARAPDGSLFVSTRDALLYLNPQGGLLWQRDLPKGVTALFADAQGVSIWATPEGEDLVRTRMSLAGQVIGRQQRAKALSCPQTVGLMRTSTGALIRAGWCPNGDIELRLINESFSQVLARFKHASRKVPHGVFHKTPDQGFVFATESDLARFDEDYRLRWHNGIPSLQQKRDPPFAIVPLADAAWAVVGALGWRKYTDDGLLMGAWPALPQGLNVRAPLTAFLGSDARLSIAWGEKRVLMRSAFDMLQVPWLRPAPKYSLVESNPEGPVAILQPAKPMPLTSCRQATAAVYAMGKDAKGRMVCVRGDGKALTILLTSPAGKVLWRQQLEQITLDPTQIALTSDGTSVFGVVRQAADGSNLMGDPFRFDFHTERKTWRFVRLSTRGEKRWRLYWQRNQQVALLAEAKHYTPQLALLRPEGRNQLRELWRSQLPDHIRRVTGAVYDGRWTFIAEGSGPHVDQQWHGTLDDNGHVQQATWSGDRFVDITISDEPAIILAQPHTRHRVRTAERRPDLQVSTPAPDSGFWLHRHGSLAWPGDSSIRYANAQGHVLWEQRMTHRPRVRQAVVGPDERIWVVSTVHPFGGPDSHESVVEVRSIEPNGSLFWRQHYGKVHRRLEWFYRNRGKKRAVLPSGIVRHRYSALHSPLHLQPIVDGALLAYATHERRGRFFPRAHDIHIVRLTARGRIKWQQTLDGIAWTRRVRERIRDRGHQVPADRTDPKVRNKRGEVLYHLRAGQKPRVLTAGYPGGSATVVTDFRVLDLTPQGKVSTERKLGSYDEAVALIVDKNGYRVLVFRPIGYPARWVATGFFASDQD